MGFNDRAAELKAVITQHAYHLLTGEAAEQKPDTSPPKQISHYLKPWELLEELLQNSFNSSTAFFEVFNEFPMMNEDDIFECVMMMSNTYPILEDSTQRMLMTLYSNTKTSNLLNFFFFFFSFKKIFFFYFLGGWGGVDSNFFTI